MQGFAGFPGRQTLNPVPACSRGREQPLGTGMVGRKAALSPLDPPPFSPLGPDSRSPTAPSQNRLPLNYLAPTAVFPVSLESGMGMAGAGLGGPRWGQQEQGLPWGWSSSFSAQKLGHDSGASRGSRMNPPVAEGGLTAASLERDPAICGVDYMGEKMHNVS